LARCLYRDAEIYLIDDPFAAVDPTVAKKIAFSVKNYLSQKTRIVVTHQAEYLQGADQFYQTKNGKINKIDRDEANLDEVEPKESMVEVNLKENKAESNTKPTENVIHGKMGFKIYVEYLSLALPFIFFIAYILFEFAALRLGCLILSPLSRAA
jgi:ABC-type proline/glycine betaine transport system ATPase subunit